MKNKIRIDPIETSLLNVQRRQAEAEPDVAWQQNLMTRVRREASAMECIEIEFPAGRFAWITAAVAAAAAGVALLTVDAGWMLSDFAFDIQQAMVNL